MASDEWKRVVRTPGVGAHGSSKSRRRPTPSPGPRRLAKAPSRATLSPKGERTRYSTHDFLIFAESLLRVRRLLILRVFCCYDKLTG